VVGYLIDRSPIQQMSTWAWSKGSLQPETLHFWNPIKGHVTPWFNVTLAGPAGNIIVSLPQSMLYEMEYGDWVEAHAPIAAKGAVVSKKISVSKPPRITTDVDLDLHWVAPAVEIHGQGKISRSINEHGDPVYITWNALRKFFGTRVPKGTREVLTVAPDALQTVGATFYSVLGLTPPILDEEDVKKAYRKKSKETHPDLNPDNPIAAAQFFEVKQAYDLLVDPAKRTVYDLMLKMTTQTYGANNDMTVSILEGPHKDGWYPPISSGRLIGKAYWATTRAVITEITRLDKVVQSNHTRICVAINGVPTLRWVP
jgi:hypothetical protein